MSAIPCARCGGHTYLERDPYGAMRSCLQCGATVDLDRDGNPAVALTLEEERELVRQFNIGRSGTRYRAPRRGDLMLG